MPTMEEVPILTDDELAVTPSAFPGGGLVVDQRDMYNEEPPQQVMKLGGLIEVAGTDTLKREELAREAAALQQNTPVIQGVAAFIRKCWDDARSAKEQTVEPRMLQSLRQRSGEYDPDILAQLKEQNSSLVYMQITSNKCRAAASWLRDALGDLPWSCEPTPVADIEPDLEKQVTETQAPPVLLQAMQTGYQPSMQEIMDMMEAMKDEAASRVQSIAGKKAERMTRKMHDQLLEGGFQEALDAFIDDLATFPAAILKGPVVRTRPSLKWVENPVTGKKEVVVQDKYKLEWERVSPFDIYPAPDASDVDDGYLIERHHLSRSDLAALRDVEGYSPVAIDGALAEYRNGWLNEIAVDSERELAEGKTTTMNENPSNRIEALQYWGPVQGSLLVEWGLDPMVIGDDFDPLKDYNIEAWLVGNYVIKLQLNPDPLNRKPYYKTSWENIPGAFWGNSIPDLCRDVQRVCNAAARAMVNNMGIASGPQVVVDISQLPKGSEVSDMYPWKIWLMGSGRMGTPQAPVSFFQPSSNAGELMNIYNTFAVLADEYTGIPRYMTGSGAIGGAGRTASGMSMLMNNAGKSIKSVVASVDRVLKPAIERLYFYNMMYSDDDDLKGDVNIVAHGALNLAQREMQQQRLNEFLNIALSNPMVNQLVGPQGVAYLLRQVVDKLGLESNKILPTPELLRVQQYLQQIAMQQQMMAQQQMAMAQQQGQTPPEGLDQRQLMNGAPQINTQAG